MQQRNALRETNISAPIGHNEYKVQRKSFNKLEIAYYS